MEILGCAGQEMANGEYPHVELRLNECNCSYNFCRWKYTWIRENPHGITHENVYIHMSRKFTTIIVFPYEEIHSE